MQANTTDMLWEARRSAAADQTSSSAIRELLKITEEPDVISFAGGLPAPACFPAEEIALAAERTLATQAKRVLQYGPTPGFPPLRELCAKIMQGRGANVSAGDVIITSGSQQALDVIGKILLDPGDTVLLEDPTYVGALQAWRPYRPRFYTLPMDDQGLVVEQLEAALVELEAAGRRPKFLYTVSTFQNPTGVTLSAARRVALLDLAERHHLPIIEDDPYGELRYSGEPIAPLAALDSQRHGGPRFVFYMSTFSKLLAPGLRVGWVSAPPRILKRVEQVKEAVDLHTGSLAQAIAAEACADGLLDRHIPYIRNIYRERRDVMLAALEQYMPATVRWTRPEGGMFLWITLPEWADGTHVLHKAVERRVAFVPGSAFFANGGGENTMRLNFSYSSSDDLKIGVQRLASVLNELDQERP
ncbi:MAG: PLP-dependent aminotransferase family protein [Roseiflexaceae bacterium]